MSLHDLIKPTGIKQSFHYGNNSFETKTSEKETVEKETAENPAPAANESIFDFQEEQQTFFAFVPGANQYDDENTAEAKSKTDFFI